MKPIELIADYKNVLRVDYQVSSVCNYTCDYCFPGSNDGKYPFRKDWELIAKNFTFLFNYYKEHTNKNKFELNLTGGEPTLWPRVEDFCNEIKKENNVVIQMITNGSRTIRWWNDYGHLFDKVILSCHHKEINIDHIIEVADLLYKKNVLINALVMIDPVEWDKCVDIIEKLKTSKHHWPIRIQKLEKTSYTEEQNKFLKNSTQRSPLLLDEWKHRNKSLNKQPIAIFPDGQQRQLSANEVSMYGWNNFYGWSCNLGKDSLFIHTNGDLSGACSQKLYNLDKFFNLFDDNFTEVFNPEIQPTICKSAYCGCVSEFNMTKKKL